MWLRFGKFLSERAVLHFDRHNHNRKSTVMGTSILPFKKNVPITVDFLLCLSGLT